MEKEGGGVRDTTGEISTPRLAHPLDDEVERLVWRRPQQRHQLFLLQPHGIGAVHRHHDIADTERGWAGGGG